jgi:hypothetical protein
VTRALGDLAGLVRIDAEVPVGQVERQTWPAR